MNAVEDDIFEMEVGRDRSIEAAVNAKFGDNAFDELDTEVDPKLMGDIFIESDAEGRGKLAGQGVVFESVSAAMADMPLPKQKRLTATEFTVLGAEYTAEIAGSGRFGIRVDANFVLRDQVVGAHKVRAASDGCWVGVDLQRVRGVPAGLEANGESWQLPFGADKVERSNRRKVGRLEACRSGVGCCAAVGAALLT